MINYIQFELASVFVRSFIHACMCAFIHSFKLIPTKNFRHYAFKDNQSMLEKGCPNLLASLGHAGRRRLVLGHTVIYCDM